MASVRKLADGRWQAQYRPVPGGKQITRTTHRKADAQRWLDEQQALVVTGHYVAPSAGKITFGAYYELWAARQIWVRGTRNGMNVIAHSVTFWDVPLSQLRRFHFELWIKKLESTHRGNGRFQDNKAGLKASTIRGRYKGIQTILRAAIADKRIPADPSSGIKLPRLRRAEASMRLPSTTQVRSLLAAAAPEFRTFISVCAFTGLRLGEAAALQVGDIDFTRHTLTVARQVQLGDSGSEEIRAPKYGSERVVHIPDNLLRLLSEHIANYSDGNHPASWVFEGTNGKSLDHHMVNYRWRKTKHAAHIEGVRLHDLRHFFASGLIAAGCDVVMVQRALGHASATVTLKTYAHMWPGAEDTTRSAAAAMFASVFQQSDERLTNSSAR